MSVFKIEKSKDYTIMSNYHLRDRNLSYKAKGLLSFMLSLPDDWDYSLAGLCSISKESRDGIRAILNELKEHHFWVLINHKRQVVLTCPFYFLTIFYKYFLLPYLFLN